MENNELRAVIKHFYLKGLTPKEIKAELDEVHGTSAPAFATVYNWNKRNHVINSEAGLTLFRCNPVEFLHRYLTVGETWICYYAPVTREQSKQRVFKGDPAPKKAKTVTSPGKVMATVFWDARGIIYVDYLAKGQTINGEYYASFLHRLS
ncbi:hypothetical protein AVEN_236337-1 [Araneus ventricosus]|uniref:Mos1 transposase HTH domain-containing protein n=1 Tax=Araneus ventricosus TaxID=182803 RepID=A0A4Y2QVP9_ARAVE|nr:hypothetical protein AVEN_236337-1 [Araneus ventricosus]